MLEGEMDNFEVLRKKLQEDQSELRDFLQNPFMSKNLLKLALRESEEISNFDLGKINTSALFIRVLKSNLQAHATQLTPFTNLKSGEALCVNLKRIFKMCFDLLSTEETD